MTRDEAYKVASHIGATDFSPQWIFQSVDNPRDYLVLLFGDPNAMLGKAWKLENYYDPRQEQSENKGWAYHPESKMLIV